MEGSKTITNELTVAALFGQMKEHSYYLGEALKANPQMSELAAKIQASTDDDSVLKDFIQEGIAKLGNILSNVLGKTSYAWDTDKSKITFTTNAVANFMDSQTGTFKDSMLNYLSYYVLARWLLLIKPDDAQRFAALLVALYGDMRILGALRSKPTSSYHFLSRATPIS